jgi:tRNA nucleotidyltransferase (CCA-adding enzyme)
MPNRMTTTHVHTDRFPKALMEVVETLAAKGHRAWIVGGCLRDLLLERPASDWDLATSARPEAVVAAFKRTIPTGIKHGTVTVVVRGTAFEVTTLRGEGAYSDGRRPDSVAFVSDIESDLARRDFTVNAIAYDPLTDALVDPFSGLSDLRAGVLRAVGEPLERFSEDGLRILRGARFTATLGFTLEAGTEAAFRPCLPVYAKVSKERVREEWVKAMKAERPSSAFVVMRRTGILGVSCAPLEALDQTAFDASVAAVDRAPMDFFVRHAALFSAVPPREVEAWLETYRYSNEERKTIAHLVAQLPVAAVHPADGKAVRRSLRAVGRAHAAMVTSLLTALGEGTPELFAAWDHELASGAPLAVRELTISGQDLLGLGRPPGKWVGETLDALLEHTLDVPADNRKETLLDLARARLG